MVIVCLLRFTVTFSVVFKLEVAVLCDFKCFLRELNMAKQGSRSEISLEIVVSKIYSVRGQRVMWDRDCRTGSGYVVKYAK